MSIYLLFALSLFVVLVSMITGNFSEWLDVLLTSGIIVIGIPISVLMMVFYSYKMHVKTQKTFAWDKIFFLMLLPFIYSFGTNQNYFSWAVHASLFWLLASFIVVEHLDGSVKNKFQPLLMFVSLFITSTTLATSFEHPYRRAQPLLENHVNYFINGSTKPLTLSRDYANYIDGVFRASRLLGFESGTPLIDLSGRSPGISYVIGAKSIGSAWVIGSYDQRNTGPLLVATAYFDLVSCDDFSKAWVLFEKDSPRRMSSRLLLSQGSHPQNYTKVASWKTPVGLLGFERQFTQDLYKPNDSNAILESCLEKRRGSQTE